MTGAIPTQGFSQMECTVLSVEGDTAKVRDQLTRQIDVRRDIMRANGTPPAVGERWIISRDLMNTWTFAARLGARTAPLPDMVFTVASFAERDAIESPWQGMTVYQRDFRITWVRDSGAWVPIQQPVNTIERVGTGDVTVTTASQDVPGTLAGFTLVVPATIKIEASFDCTTTATTTGYSFGQVAVNGVVQSNQFVFLSQSAIDRRGGVVLIRKLLVAGDYSVALRTSKQNANGTVFVNGVLHVTIY